MTFVVVPEREAWTCQATMNDRGLIQRTHTEVYRIESTDFVPPFLAQSALGLPTFGVYSVDPTARLRDANTVWVPDYKDPYIYRSTIKYASSCPEEEQQNREEDDPLDDQPEIEIDGEIVLVPMFRDRDDVLIANTADQPIAGIEEERAIEVMTVTRNESFRDSARDRYFRNTVNLNSWNGADPGTVKITRIRATRMYRNAIRYYRYFYELRYNEKGWQPKVLNAGTKQYIPDGPSFRKVDCVDGDNNPVNDAVPLDNNGKQIADTALPGAAVYLTFNTIRATNFADLGLPTSD